MRKSENALAAVLGILCCVAMANAATPQLDGFRRLPVQPLDVGFVSPAPVRLEDGSLLLAYQEFPTRTLLVTLSADSGATWSEPTVVAAGEGIRPSAGMRMLRLASGRIVLTQNGSAGRTAMFASDNGGADWLALPARDVTGIDRFAVVDGSLWHFFANPTGTEHDVRYDVSRDGVNWGNTRLMVQNPARSTTVLHPIDIARVGANEYLLLVDRQTFDPCCSRHLEVFRSTDAGESWKGPEDPNIEVDGLGFTATQMLVDGELAWILGEATGPISPDSTSSLTSDIYFSTGTNGQSTWTGLEALTRFIGDDFDVAALPNAAGGAIAFFSSGRFSAPDIPQIWFGTPGITLDSNPPPSVFEDTRATTPTWSAPGVTVPVSFAAADETEAVDVEVVTERDGVIEASPLFDDGLHADGDAGDGIWGGTIGPFELGSDVLYFARAFDESGQTGKGTDHHLQILPVHNAGLVQLALGLESNFGGFFVPDNPPKDAGQWPGATGQNYLGGGGLWVGASVDSEDRVMHYYYDQAPESGDWRAIPGVFPKMDKQFSDQDIELVYSDSAAPVPIGLTVAQTSRQWSDPELDEFLVFEHQITNVSDRDLEGVFASMWLDPDIVLEHLAFIEDDLVAWDPDRHMIYASDAGIACNDPLTNPDDLICPPGHVGLILLTDPVTGKTMPAPHAVAVWDPDQDPHRKIDDSDSEFMSLMSGPVDESVFDSTARVPNDYRMLITPRPAAIQSGGSITVAFGIVLGEDLEALQTNADEMVATYSSLPLASGEDQILRELPGRARVGRNYPNPFSDETTIRFELDKPALVRLRVFNLLGEQVAEFGSEYRPAGRHEQVWRTEGLPSGVYFSRIEIDGNVEVGRMLLVRR